MRAVCVCARGRAGSVARAARLERGGCDFDRSTVFERLIVESLKCAEIVTEDVDAPVKPVQDGKVMGATGYDFK